MTEAQRAKEYLLDTLTENKIEKDLRNITENFIYEFFSKNALSKLINEIQSYMKILEIEKKIKYWRIDDIVDDINIIFKVYKDELKITIHLHS